MVVLSDKQPGDAEQVQPDGSLKARYEALQVNREVFLKRARAASVLTIPTLIPPMGHSAVTNLPTPWQGLGARGVNNLSAKILMALFPPNSPFFRAQLDAKLVVSLTDADKTDFEEGLAKTERIVTSEFEAQAFRPSLFEVIKHLVVGGNVLLWFPQAGGVKVFHLDSYVVKRDPMGNVLEIVVQEELAPASLPDDLKALLKSSAKHNDKNVFRHTGIKRTDKGYEVCQELNGVRIPGCDYTYPLDAPAWLPLRWIKVDGEDYGRGYVEEYQGDLQSLETLSRAIVEGSAAAAKVLFLVNPSGTTSAKTLDESPNGAIREGNAADVTVLQMNKYNDFKIALETIKDISERLAFAFMLNSAIQRQGERVTAAEIRYMAQELETTLGGVYSLMSQELQLPLIHRLMDQMASQKKLPKLPKKSIKLTIITGLEALGRGNDQDRLNEFMASLQPLGPQVIAQYLNVSDYIKRSATSIGIDTTGLINTPDQVAATQQQATQQATASTLGPEVVKQAGQYITKHGAPPPGVGGPAAQGTPNG